MTDTLQLEFAIRKAGFTKKEVAERLGMSEAAFYNKLSNNTEFKASEIATLYDLLNLQSLEEQQKIFLTNM